MGTAKKISARLYLPFLGGLLLSCASNNQFALKELASYPSLPTTRNIYLGMETQGLLLALDGGTTLTRSVDGLGDLNIEDIFVQNGIIYVATWGGVSISKDDGKSFTNHTKGLLNHKILSIVVDKKQTIYAGPVAGGIAISKDGGKTFTSYIHGIGRNSAKDIFVDNEGIIYVAVGMRVCISRDGGITFESAVDGLGGRRIEAVFVSDGIIYAGTSRGLAISKNNGKSFEHIGPNFSGEGGVRHLVAKDGIIYIGNTKGIYISRDGGKNFEYFGIRIWVSDLFVDNEHTLYAVSFKGLFIIKNLMNASSAAYYKIKNLVNGDSNDENTFYGTSYKRIYIIQDPMNVHSPSQMRYWNVDSVFVETTPD